MPRSRNIKPAFFKNEELAELDHGGRLLFIGLWCLADRNGLIDYRPKRIKIELFPYDPDIDVNGYITVMGRLGLIQLLTDGESDWLYIPTFTKHQNPHHTEKTVYPDPNSLKPKEEKDLTVTSPLSNVRNLADSCSLNPDSLTLIPERGTPITPSIKTKPRFADFWLAYPKKKEKKKAETIWKRRKLDELADKIIADVKKRALIDDSWKGGFIPNPTTYLNGDRWEDSIEGKAGEPLGEWHSSASGILSKAAELGIDHDDNEPVGVLKYRVAKHLGIEL